LARSREGTVFLTGQGATVLLQGSAIRIEFQGADLSNVLPVDPLPGVVNYFVGPDPSHWRSGLPTFGEVKYAGAYPGVDLVFHGTARALEYDFLLRPRT